jgi:O-antigen ligase
MNNSGAFPINVSVAPPHTAPFEPVIEFERSRSYRLTCIGLLLWWIASLYPLIAVRDIEERLQEAARDTAQGSLINQLLVISFAILGSQYLPRAIRALRSSEELRSLLYLLAAYLLWSAATIFWSDDIELSIRRLGVLVLLLSGAFGLGAGFYLQTRERTLTIARHVLYASWIAVTLLLASRLWNQDFSEMINPEWTLSGDTPTQFYVYPVAYGIIAAIVLYSGRRIKQVMSISLLGLVLVLLKGRTMIAGTVASGLLISSRLSRRTLRRTVVFLISIVLLLVQVDLATGGKVFLSSLSFVTDQSSPLLAFVTTGHGMDDLLSLDGRVPLWQTLWPYFCERPIVGYGFGAFWNPSRFDDIYAEAKWRAVAAHNGFLDELLGTGVVGLLLFLSFWFAGMRLNVQVARQYKRAGCLVFGWMLLFLCFNGMTTITQSYFQSPTIFSITALFTLLARPTNYNQ